MRQHHSFRSTARRWAASLFTVGCALAVALHAEMRPVDAARSNITTLVFETGLSSALADDHIIKAPIASGSISSAAPLAINVLIRAADLQVLDPNLSASRRAEVQARMHGPEVLDTSTFPEISFASTTIVPAPRIAGR